MRFLLSIFLLLFLFVCSAQNSDLETLVAGKKYYEAIDLLDGELRKDKKNTDLLLKRADVFYLLNDYRNGLQDLESAFDKGIDDIKYIELAFIGAQKTNDKKRMFRYIDKLSINDSIYLKYAHVKCELFLKDDKFEEAYVVAIKIKESNSSAYINYLVSKCAIKLDKFDEALSCINVAIDLEKGKQDYFLQRGEVHAALEEYAKASLDYSMVLDLNPRNAEAYFLRGELKAMMADEQGACFDFQKAAMHKHPYAADKVFEYCGE